MAPRSSDLTRLCFGAAAAQHVRRTGRTPMGDAIWTQREIGVCRSLHPDFILMGRRLPRRTEGAIREMCRRLGLTEPSKPWTAAERTRLRRLYPSAPWPIILSEFPGRTRQAIIQKAHRWKLSRDRKPYKRTSHEAVDQIRQRCLETGLFMPDIDCLANTNFFTRKAVRRKKPDLLAVDRAAKVFGGRLLVEWGEGED